jgi:hypothetical protein
MPGRWIKRREHIRRIGFGRWTRVRESRVFCEAVDQRANGYVHPCPICGEPILSIHMRNGGWLHVGAAVGLRRVKHACMHLGEGLSHRRDSETPDLFDFQE